MTNHIPASETAPLLLMPIRNIHPQYGSQNVDSSSSSSSSSRRRFSNETKSATLSSSSRKRRIRGSPVLISCIICIISVCILWLLCVVPVWILPRRQLRLFQEAIINRITNRVVSIPLTPARLADFPKWAPPNDNGTVTTTTTTRVKTPFTKLGVVQTRPGQGSFFYYWFGHVVFPQIRQLQVGKNSNNNSHQTKDGVLALALHAQQGQPDTFWLLQTFTSEAYYLNVYTPTIYTHATIAAMRKFLSEDAPLLDLDVTLPPLCVKGLPKLGKFLKQKRRRRRRMEQRRKMQQQEQQQQIEEGLLLPPPAPGTIYPPPFPPPQPTWNDTKNVSKSVDELVPNISTYPTDNKNAHHPPDLTLPTPPYTVMMHLTLLQRHHDNAATSFAEWFRSNVCHPIIRNDDTIINYVMYMVDSNHVWMYQTHRSERDFLEHATALYTTRTTGSSTSSSALTLPWWSQQQQQQPHPQQQQTNNATNIDTIIAQQELLLSFLRKPVEYVALEPTSIHEGIHSMPGTKNDSFQAKAKGEKEKKAFSPLHSIRHPP
jgi:hypothetical protein